MSMQPDNFLYFICLFTFALGGACYLFFTFRRSWIIWGNILMFLFCAIRISTEYAIHQIESYQVAVQVAAFHSIVITTVSYISWVCTYAYIRPLRQWRYEDLFHRIGATLLLFIYCLHMYPLSQRIVYHLLPEKIDGHWVFFTSIESQWLTFIYTVSIVFSIFMIFLFISDIVRTRKKIFFKSILLLSFLVIPSFLVYLFHSKSINTDYQIPNIGITYLIHTTIISWFCSDYRLFQNSFNNTTNDILNSIADLTVFTDLQLRTLFTNQSFTQYFGVEKHTIVELLLPYCTLNREQLNQELAQLIAKESLEKELTFNIHNQQYYFSIQAQAFYQMNQHLGYIFIMHNLTLLRKKERLLDRANQTKDRLFAIIGHDLRNPILSFRNIAGKVRYLLQQKDYTTLDLVSSEVEKQARILSHLTDNLLKWILRQKNILTYQPTAVSLLPIVSIVNNIFEEAAKEKGITINTSIPSDLEIYADYNTLSTIIRNLVDNAIKYSPVGSEINITALTTPDTTQLEIKDNGIGIPSDKLSDLFSLDAHKSTIGTAGEKGTGLGLYLIKELVELNKGQIKVKSQLTLGTTFQLIFPL